MEAVRQRLGTASLIVAAVSCTHSTPPISYLSLILFNALDESVLSTRVFIPIVMGHDG